MKSTFAKCTVDRLRDLHVEFVSTASLTPYLNNARAHSQKQLEQIEKSIREFGFTNPVLTDEKLAIIAGHGRIEAAKSLGMPTVPIIRISGLTDAQKRALRLADNKIADNAGWNVEILALELRDLVQFETELDLTVTGFETPELDLYIGSVDDNTDPALDNIPDVDRSAAPISQPGDVWLLGRHRLMCGDATKPNSFAELMNGEEAQMVFIDPPYNVPIAGNVSGLGDIKHGEFVMASGEMSEGEFVSFLSSAFNNVVKFAKDGAIHFVCMDWRHTYEITAAARGIYDSFQNLCIWNKTNGGMGSLYRSKHELVFVFKSGTAPHVNNVQLGRFGRNRTNVWDYPGANTFGDDRSKTLPIHPTVKPVQMVVDAMLDCSDRNGIILDCFAGSGTTLIAAEATGRRAYTMELDPYYVDSSILRYQDAFGAVAVHKHSGQSFENVLTSRAGSNKSDPSVIPEPKGRATHGR